MIVYFLARLVFSIARLFLFTTIIIWSAGNYSLFLDSAYSISDSTIHKLDRNGVPITDYGCKGELYIGPQRNPLHIAQEAKVLYDRYDRTNDQRSLQGLVNNSNWLVENLASFGNYSILSYNFSWPPYIIQPPWYSALAQGNALTALIKAHQATGNKTYLDTAKSLLNSFYVEVKDGGVTIKTPDGGWWYEEYAKPGATQSQVLNGMTNALLGINDYYQYTKDPAAKFLFDQGVTALKKSIPKYEYFRGEYSTYDILNSTRPAPFNYHLAQTDHLGKLYNITGDDIFKTYYDRWTHFRLPKNVQNEINIYDNRDQLIIDFAPLEEIRDHKLTIKNIENMSSEGAAQFRVLGNSGNQTTRFVSDEFYFLAKDISVYLMDELNLYSNLGISFVVIREGMRDEVMVKFVHGIVNSGWQDGGKQYYLQLESKSSKSVNVEHLFGNEDRYMVVKQVVIDVPRNSCLDSLNFKIDLLRELDDPIFSKAAGE